ncbi:uncharacterized protein LOC127240674 [Andrographis paniculata]|uniref:uncharacterized protein LOC127240674 n=1 Tax=Andrographis paniculata TaxID=175694 RepID=UPI0021E896FB|nr:uncharacterized protein LOC127240674 [Andrographis paniculata]
MAGVDERQESFYRLLMDRFQGLEASHQKLQEQFQVLMEERAIIHHNRNANIRNRGLTADTGDLGRLPGWASIPGAYFVESPYRRVLEQMGHALYVYRIIPGEITYWNRAAEKLYGYKANDILGRRISELHLEVENSLSTQEIVDKLYTRRAWAGQLPLRKRSGQIFMGMVTKSALYEDGELAAIVTVSSDAAIFNHTKSGPTNQISDHYDGRKHVKKIYWQPQPRISAVPQIANSVSNMASKVLPRKQGEAAPRATPEYDDTDVDSYDMINRPPRAPMGKPHIGVSMGPASRPEVVSSEKEFIQPSRSGVKPVSNVHLGGARSLEREVDEYLLQNGSDHNFRRKEKEAAYEASHRKDPLKSAYQGQFDGHRSPDRLQRTNSSQHDKKVIRQEDAPARQSGSIKTPSSGESVGSGESSLSRNENDPHKVVNSEIRWEDLQVKEEIGQGSYAVVYRGVWNGSDVAVKVYFGNQYSEETLLDYKKEIDIMRRLRHPNVLLFMGAVCTEEKLAMVTEYLIRGSLFKTLHKNNQSLDIRRRIRMAIDVARGMNYLHHRNPPIVHRDLKSSNLLVDKSWTVKVGDFGLSKLKHATFLTAKSGRGTPQWMAPEVLRNEPSTEKSDIFSFGVILWELMTECVPWSNLNPLQVVGVVGFMDRRLDIPDNIDPQVSSIISDCWKSNPEDRPSFEVIINRMTAIIQKMSEANGPARPAAAP